jgi:hypothetical protein
LSTRAAAAHRPAAGAAMGRSAINAEPLSLCLDTQIGIRSCEIADALVVGFARYFSMWAVTLGSFVSAA